jgi:hypothetical protein
VPQKALTVALERLILAYVLVRENRQFVWPVPLVKAFILLEADEDPIEALRLEARDWRAAQTA